jgi:hypothetical protein
MRRLYELTLALADGRLDLVGEAELARLLESDPLARQRHVELLALEAALRGDGEGGASEAVAAERSVRTIVQKIEGSGRRRSAWLSARTTPLLIGLGACVALVGWWWLGSGPSAGRHAGGAHLFASRRTGAAPHARVTSGAPHLPAALGPAAPLRLRLDGPPARLALGGGLALEVRSRELEGALASADGPGPRLFVADGVVAIVRDGAESGAGEAAEITVLTPHAEVTARSAHAVVAVTGEGTEIDVHEGRAVVSRPGGRRFELGPREGATIAAAGAPVVHTLPVVLFVGGSHFGRFPTDLLEEAVIRRFEQDGFAVEVVDESQLAAPALDGKALLFVSPSTSGVVGARFRELRLDQAPLPILCSRPSAYADLGMTGPGPELASFSSGPTRLEILEPGHPLASGLAGPQQVTRAPGSLGWGVPGGEALTVAVFPDRRKSARSTIFAYERGAELATPGTHSPARRVGFFLHPDLAPYLTDRGWALFDAAVKWAVAAPEQGPSRRNPAQLDR